MHARLDGGVRRHYNPTLRQLGFTFYDIQGPKGDQGTPGITGASVSVDANVGTPSVDASIVNSILTLAFHNLRGAAAGFGTPTISVGANQGTPSASVTASGPDTAKVFHFAFDGLKGETGPQGPQGPQGNPGSNQDYPFTLANNLTTDDSTVALTAAMGVQLEGEVSQLSQELTDIEEQFLGSLNAESSGDTEVTLHHLLSVPQAARVELSTRNILHLPYDNIVSGTPTWDYSAFTYNGVTITPNHDGSLTLSGTCSAQFLLLLRSYYHNSTENQRITFQPGKYTLSLKAPGMGGSLRLSAGGFSGFAYDGYPSVINVASETLSAITLTITTSFSSTGVTIYPQIEKGDVATPFQTPTEKPYQSSETFPTTTLTVSQSEDTQFSIVGGVGSISLNGDPDAVITSQYPVTVKVSYKIEDSNIFKKTVQAFSSSVGENVNSDQDDSFTSGDKISLITTLAKKNKTLTFFANVQTIGTIQFRHGDQLYNSGDVTIDGTNVVVRTYGTSYTERLNVPHGLSITDYIAVTLSVGDTNNLSILIKTNGGSYSRTGVYFSASNGAVEVEAISGTYSDARASWVCESFRSPVWIFGDSYIDTQNSARWPKYLVDEGFNTFFASGYPGAESASVLPDFINSLNYGTPRFVLWALGMNDPDSGSVNASWLSCVESFIAACEIIGAIPILATIPNTPTRNHTYKNAWVKASGFRYVDFAAAVGASTYPSNWYTGMLSTDNVHPLDPGAIALEGRVLADMPEVTRCK